MVEFVIKQHPHLLDADIAPGWGSPLNFAMAKNPDCLGVLLKLGVDLYKLSFIKSRIYFPFTRLYDTNYAPMAWAAATRNEVVVDFLLSHTKGHLPNDILHVAVGVDNPSHEFIRKFRQRGADVNFTVHGSTPIHDFLSFSYYKRFDEYRNPSLPVVKALVEPSCNLSLRDRTARTALHIALDDHMEDIVAYLLEKNAGLSATATLHSDMWSWATNKPWFPKVQATVLAADKPCTRVKEKVIHDTAQSRLVEFPVPVTVNPNPICAFVFSASTIGELSSERLLSPTHIIY
jgi:ankyrin repeat protein